MKALPFILCPTLFLFAVVLLGQKPNNPSSSGICDCDVYRAYDHPTISMDELASASTLEDLNHRYESAWVKKYYDVTVKVRVNDTIQHATSRDNHLTAVQKDLMQRADHGSLIRYTISYLPDNLLADNEAKINTFSFVVEPSHSARYPEGHDALLQYLRQSLCKHIADTILTEWGLAAARFTISSEGIITHPMIVESSKHIATDELLLKTICNMPMWTAASYDDGTPVDQDYVLVVGNTESCTMNLLPIDHTPPH